MQFTGDKLFIGSHNQYKINQLKLYLIGFGHNLKILSPKDFNILAPAELGNTFEENCESKAIYYGNATGLITVSDDSGICIDSLGGAPGVHTADWAVNGDFKPAIVMLKQKLHSSNGDKHTAKMVSVISIYNPKTSELQSFRAESTGYINFDHMDSPGVGFQPIFYPHPYTKPASLLTDEEHKQVNARTKSLKKLLDACF